MSLALDLTSAGLTCSLGHRPIETYAAIRAGASRFRRTHLIGRAGPMVAAPALTIAADCEGLERAHALSDSAHRDALEPRLQRLRGARVGLVVSGPSLGIADDARLPPFVARRLAALRTEWERVPFLVKLSMDRAGLSMPEGGICSIRKGHAGSLAAFAIADALAEKLALDAVVVAAIASQCERFQMETLDALGWLRSEASSEGWVPSEAAAIAVLERGGSYTRVWAAFASETRGSPSETQGLALSAAIEKALRRSGALASDIAEVWSDQNGERWRAHEWALASARSLGVAGASPPVVHPAEVLGDLGAASGASLAILAQLAAREQGRPVLVTASSRGPLRSAAVVVPPPGGG